MTDKEKIRAYIESQIALLEKNDTGNPVLGVSAGVVMAELRHLLSFIDSLQEPVSVDLANAAIEYCGGDKASDARVRAAFVVGANWQKEQMMKDAVYGLVCGHDDNSPAWIDLNLLNKPDVKVGEEIKLIIIKEK